MNSTIRVTTVFFLLALSSVAFARFSQLVILKNTEELKKHSLSLKVNKKEQSYSFSVSGVKKGAWVIKTAKEAKGVALNFRTKIWYNTYTKAVIEEEKELEVLKGRVAFTVKAEDIKKTYLYLDFKAPVQDGGFYYTLPLKNFIKDHKKKIKTQ